MERQTRRRRPDFWYDFGDYIRRECISILKILGLCMLCLFIAMSLLVGMYHVAMYYIVWILTGEPPNL